MKPTVQAKMVAHTAFGWSKKPGAGADGAVDWDMESSCRRTSDRVCGGFVYDTQILVYDTLK